MLFKTEILSESEQSAKYMYNQKILDQQIRNGDQPNFPPFFPY